MWQLSNIIPVPKTPTAAGLNGFRLVALTSIPSKCMERVIASHLTTSLRQWFDPFQFAYRRGATLTLMNSVTNHLQQPKSYARLLFIDFSSAFNCIQKLPLTERLCSINTNRHILEWIKEFLTDWPQRVRCSGVTSDTVILNTGAPQGCVLSPVLFCLYTNEMQITNSSCQLYEYADDVVLLGLMKVGDTVSQSSYFHRIAELTSWCKDSSLAATTKELVVMSHQRICEDLPPVVIHDQHVEAVQEFKYLGTFFDRTLSFTANTEYIFKKAMKRLYLIRKLDSFDVSKNILELVYQSLLKVFWLVIYMHGMVT